MPGYLTIDMEHVCRAWEECATLPESASILSDPEQCDFGRRAVVVHVPQSWPHGIYCRNCHGEYPCRIALWGMALLNEHGWDFGDVADLIEAIQAGEPL